MRERIDRAAGQQVWRLRVPIDVGDDPSVRPQRVYQRRVTGAPRHHLDELACCDGAILLRLVANGPLGGGDLVLRVAVVLFDEVLVVYLVLVEFLQCQMPPNKEVDTH